MAKLAWTPWHKVVQLREDVKSGELSLAILLLICTTWSWGRHVRCIRTRRSSSR